ncbi:MAG: hypothetical protein KA073_00900 [Aliarcobacter sp.]|nr:hypothetical protein [Aliarcobacter sp.]
MIKKSVFFILIILLFTSCTINEKQKIKISINNWIGYTPLFYAKEKSWLESIDVKLLNVVSLNENAHLYKAGNSDAYVGTQFEYHFVNKKDNSLTPIILFNRSNGGDIILSNLSIDELSKTDKIIDAYLEIDSINSILLEDFLVKNNLTNHNINYIDENQSNISRLKAKDMKNPTIIVTYLPYNHILKKNSFIELSSTKDNPDLLVIDAMYTTQNFYFENQETFIKLKKLIDKAISNLQNDPKEFYETIKPYMLNTSYEEFLSSLTQIVWLNKEIPENILHKLNNSDFKTKDLIK